MSTLDELEKLAGIELPSQDYILRFGAAFYSVAYAEHDMKYKIRAISTIYGIELNRKSRETTGDVFKVFKTALMQSQCEKLFEEHDWFEPRLTRILDLRNALAHGTPISDSSEGYAQKLFKEKFNDSPTGLLISPEIMDELIALAAEIRKRISDLKSILLPVAQSKGITEIFL